MNVSDFYPDGKGGGEAAGSGGSPSPEDKNALLRHGVPKCGEKPAGCRAAFLVRSPAGMRWRRCGRANCSRECRDQFAWRTCLSLRLSFRELPPDFFCTLHPRGQTPRGSFASALAKFFRTLVRLAAVEWFRILEWRRGVVHAHGLLRGRVTRRVLRAARHSSGLWASCRRVHTVPGVAAYIVKHTRRVDRKAELAPANFSGRLHSASRSFLTKPFRVLWKAVKDECAARKGGVA